MMSSFMMPSQGLKSFPDHSLCLPLLKFSYSTASNDNFSTVPWIHLASKNDLFAVFESAKMQTKAGTFEDRPKFKVMRDPEIMEDIDLQALSAEAHRALALAQDPKSHKHTPNVTIVVKVPLIAMRYPFSDGQVRRFQVRFVHDEDFYEAMKRLSRANVPTLEAGSFPSNRPRSQGGSVISHQLGPGDSISQVGSRPTTSASYIGSNVQEPPIHSRMGISSVIPPKVSNFPSMPMPPPTDLPIIGNNPDIQDSQHHVLNGTDDMNNKSTGISVSINGSKAVQLPRFTNEQYQDQNVTNSGDLHIAYEGQKPSVNQNAQTSSAGGNTANIASANTDYHMSSILPPKRELPFKPSIPRSDASSPNNIEPTIQKLHSEEETGVAAPSTAAPPNREGLDVEDEGQKSNQTSGKRKRPVAKGSSNATVPKKPRSSAGRKKTIEKAGQEGSSLVNSQPQLKSIATVNEHVSNPISETNASLETLSHVGQTKHIPSTDSFAKIPHVLKPHETPRPDYINVSNTVEFASSTIVEQGSEHVTNVLNPIPVLRSTNEANMENPANPSSKSIQEPNNLDSNHTTEDQNTAFQSQTVSMLKVPHSKSDLELLTADPAFANSEMKLSNWSNLSEDKQIIALETYVCQQFRNPNFIKLCQTMENVWPARLVYP